MSLKKNIGILLICACLITIMGFIFKNHIYWLFMDTYNIIICGIAGIFFLIKK